MVNLALLIVCCVALNVGDGDAFSISPKTFKVNGLGPCPEEKELPVRPAVTFLPLAERNKFVTNGSIAITEDINGPIELHFRTQRCSLDMTHCENFDVMTVPDMCVHLKDKNIMWADMMAKIQPKLTCPLRKVYVNYEFGSPNTKDNIFDFTWDIHRSKRKHRSVNVVTFTNGWLHLDLASALVCIEKPQEANRPLPYVRIRSVHYERDQIGPQTKTDNSKTEGKLDIRCYQHPFTLSNQ